MSENKPGIGDGILRGLKRIIFNSDHHTDEETGKANQPAVSPAPVNSFPEKPVQTETKTVSDFAGITHDKERRLRVYQLLEKMNKPGCDFFEVWNASVEMGGANNNNIKAAYTSLRFADPSLSRIKLEESGNYYMSELKKILDAETSRRVEEKSRLEKEMEQHKTALTNEISTIEQDIKKLQDRLEQRRKERETLNEKYLPQVSTIDEKIKEGSVTVNGVLLEMQQVMQIIQQEIK